MPWTIVNPIEFESDASGDVPLQHEQKSSMM